MKTFTQCSVVPYGLSRCLDDSNGRLTLCLKIKTPLWKKFKKWHDFDSNTASTNEVCCLRLMFVVRFLKKSSEFFISKTWTPIRFLHRTEVI